MPVERDQMDEARGFLRVEDKQERILADLHPGMESTLNIVKNEIKHRARIVKHCGAPPELECGASEINQVFMNPFVNACYTIQGDAGCITISSGRAGDQAWLEIADNARDIDAGPMKRICDPFVTTRPVGQGTGLGGPRSRIRLPLPQPLG